jgi:citrate lyase subunit gamma (acyl carrier protein)
VAQQFGQSILETVREVFAENGVENANVRVVDRGALDCVIRARVETAILRGKGDA